MEVIQGLLRSDSEDIRHKALSLLWDRRWGKAPQAITGEDGQPIRFDIGIVDVLRKMVAIEEPAE